MDLVGAWVRQLLGAGMAAAIVPIAMFAAVVVALVATGGFGGLGSLGQLIGGPQISPAEQAAVRQSQGTAVARVAPPTIVARVQSSQRRRTGAARDQGAGRQPHRARPFVRGHPLSPPLVGVGPPPAPPPQAPATPPRPVMRPTAREHTQPVTDLLEKTVGGVRAVVGRVIDRLGRTVEKVIGPPPLGL
jgi:hypothetical protein